MDYETNIEVSLYSKNNFNDVLTNERQPIIMTYYFG